MKLLTERHKEEISGVIRCFDRIVLTGTLPVLSNADQMTAYLYYKGIRIFDYPKFAEPYRDRINENAKEIAAKAGITIEFIRKKGVRKESLMEAILKSRGEAPGLVHILSVMEGCTTYKPWHDKSTHKTYLKYSESKCLTYYFYFIDKKLGLGYVRVPTWLPFRLQVYFNGHSLLSSELKSRNISHRLIDNAFVEITNWEKAQQISDQMDISQLHKIMDVLAKRYCPVFTDFGQVYHWSIMQCEYATDIVFNKQEELKPIYELLISTAIHTVKPDHIATFLGKKLHGNFAKEIGNNYDLRIEGSRIKHNMSNKVSIKMYDKLGHIIRIETTVNDVTFFKHYREVIQRNGETIYKEAAMKKNIYSLPDLMKILQESNQRYLEFISSIDDPTNGIKKLEKITEPVVESNRRYSGFNFFKKTDQVLLHTLLKGEFLLNGFQCKDIASTLKMSGSSLSRVIKKLRVHGIVKKIKNSYRYLITKLGLESIISAFKIKNQILIPYLAKY